MKRAQLAHATLHVPLFVQTPIATLRLLMWPLQFETIQVTDATNIHHRNQFSVLSNQDTSHFQALG